MGDMRCLADEHCSIDLWVFVRDELSGRCKEQPTPWVNAEGKLQTSYPIPFITH